MLNHVWLFVATMGLILSGGCVAQQADVVRMKHDFDEKITQLGQSRSELERAVADAQASLKEARSVIAQQQEDIRQLSQSRRILHDQVGVLRDDEVAPLRGEVEQALHAMASLRSELEGLQSVTRNWQEQSLRQHQEMKLTISNLSEKVQQQGLVQANYQQSDAAFRASLNDFKQVLEALHVQVTQQAGQVRQLEDRVQRATQTLTSNGSQTSAYLLEVRGSVASLAASLKETHQTLLSRLEQQEQRMSQLSRNAPMLSVKNVEGAASSEDLLGLLSTVTQLRETIGLVAKQLGDRVDAHEEELTNLGRRQVVRSSPTINSTLPSVQVQGNPLPTVSHQQKALPVVNSKQQVSSFEQEFYQSAFQLLQKDQAELARARFSEFLRQYPTSPLAANAQYWKGECYYSSQQYESAIREFDLVLKHYPTDEKAPAALLKIGYSHLALKKPILARTSFHELVRRFPQSAEAIKGYAKMIDVRNLVANPS